MSSLLSLQSEVLYVAPIKTYPFCSRFTSRKKTPFTWYTSCALLTSSLVVQFRLQLFSSCVRLGSCENISSDTMLHQNYHCFLFVFFCVVFSHKSDSAQDKGWHGYFSLENSIVKNVEKVFFLKLIKTLECDSPTCTRISCYHCTYITKIHWTL